jgi:hypothetical protein
MLLCSVGVGEPRDKSPRTGIVYACRFHHCDHSGAVECQAGPLSH